LGVVAIRFAHAGALTDEISVVIRLGGDVHPVVKHRVEPKYPTEAIEHGLEGDVQAMVLFGIDGLVKDVKLLSGDASLAQSVSTAFMPLCN
jgi:Gram-negative bacterial TonB protein C-terminal